MALLTETLGDEQFRNIADTQGRPLQPSAVLFALQLMKEPSHPLFSKTAQNLADRLNDYGDPLMPSNQRRFLMQQLNSLWKEYSMKTDSTSDSINSVRSRRTSVVLWIVEAFVLGGFFALLLVNRLLKAHLDIYAVRDMDAASVVLDLMDNLLAYLVPFGAVSALLGLIVVGVWVWFAVKEAPHPSTFVGGALIILALLVRFIGRGEQQNSDK